MVVVRSGRSDVKEPMNMPAPGTTPGEPIAQDELDRRVIEPDQFVADTKAFVDVRIPRSRGKASYSFVGPGVSQNADQTINLVEPHGFNVGAASMPAGVVNNPHLHFTPEVFICTRGEWRLDIGEHGDQQIELREGGIFSAPNWVFRGFTNLGTDDGWIFVVLGGDDTGGIIWAPHVLDESAATGMYLGPDNVLVDAAEGPAPEPRLRPFDAAQLASVEQYTDSELRARLVEHDELAWSDRSLLSAVLDGHRSALAPVIGHGMTEARRHSAPITTAHGFSVEWLRLEGGATTGLHRHSDTQVLFLVDGDWEIALNEDSSATSRPVAGSVVSVPRDSWRTLTNRGLVDAHAVVVNGSDSSTHIEWSSSIVAAAAEAGWVLDAAGCIAPRHLIDRHVS